VERQASPRAAIATPFDATISSTIGAIDIPTCNDNDANNDALKEAA
jgi:hypothetical protein